MNRIPKPGEFYRDIENKLYQIMTTAEHTETGETLVIYQALYGTYPVFAMPLLQFNRRADQEKPSRIEQEYQFEPVKFLSRKPSSAKEPQEEEFLDEEGESFEELSFEEVTLEESSFETALFETPSPETASHKAASPEANFAELPTKDPQRSESEAIAWLERFLDADRYEKQLEVLAQMRGKVGKRELDSICLVLGIPVSAGDEESQISNIKKHLETRMRYDNRRLR